MFVLDYSRLDQTRLELRKLRIITMYVCMYVCSSMYVCMYVTASQCAHICTYIYIAITRARANHNNYVCMYVCTMYVTASQCAFLTDFDCFCGSKFHSENERQNFSKFSKIFFTNIFSKNLTISPQVLPDFWLFLRVEIRIKKHTTITLCIFVIGEHTNHHTAHGSLWREYSHFIIKRAWIFT